jgi:hypothetical protein
MAPRTKKTTKKKTTKKQAPIRASKASPSSCTPDHWKTYRVLQKRVDTAWQQLQTDVRKKAPAHVLVKSKNQLLLLLGECNYMARECMRIADAQKTK